MARDGKIGDRVEVTIRGKIDGQGFFLKEDGFVKMSATIINITDEEYIIETDLIINDMSKMKIKKSMLEVIYI